MQIPNLISNLTANKSCIVVPVKCFNPARDHIYEAMTEVYNLSIEQGIMPDILKISKVTPVDKGGDITDPTNFRSISVLSIFTQIFETLMCTQLTSYVEKHAILSQYQFGFRKGRSTEQAILEITDNLKQAVDNNLLTCGVFLDFANTLMTFLTAPINCPLEYLQMIPIFLRLPQTPSNYKAWLIKNYPKLKSGVT